MSRKELNPSTFNEYLDNFMTKDNYIYLHMLQLLNAEYFKSIAEALINYEIVPEDLILLGTMSEGEINTFISNYIGRWDTKYLSSPYPGNSEKILTTPFYKYLLEDLVLNEYLELALFSSTNDKSRPYRYFIDTLFKHSGIFSGYYPDLQSLLTDYNTLVEIPANNKYSLSSFLDLFPYEEASIKMLGNFSGDTSKEDLFYNYYLQIYNSYISRLTANPSSSFIELFFSITDGETNTTSYGLFNNTSNLTYYLLLSNEFFNARKAVIREVYANGNKSGYSSEDIDNKINIYLNPSNYDEGTHIKMVNFNLDSFISLKYNNIIESKPDALVIRDVFSSLMDVKTRQREYLHTIIDLIDKHIIAELGSKDGTLIL